MSDRISIIKVDGDQPAILLDPLQNLIGAVDPHIEGWKEAEERKVEESRKKAHEVSIKVGIRTGNPLALLRQGIP
jgi:hypothetical protein